MHKPGELIIISKREEDIKKESDVTSVLPLEKEQKKKKNECKRRQNVEDRWPLSKLFYFFFFFFFYIIISLK